MKYSDGYTLIETLVSIVLVGLLVTLTMLYFSSYFKVLPGQKHGEAFMLAKNHMEYCMHNTITTDTVFTDNSGTLQLMRTVSKHQQLQHIQIVVQSTLAKKELLKMHIEKFVYEK